MSFSNETCNVIIVITAVILGVLAFTKDISEKYRKAKFVDSLSFKVVVVAVCTFIGWKLSVIKDHNSDAEKRSVRHLDSTEQKKFEVSLNDSLDANRKTMLYQKQKIDSLTALVQTKDDQIIQTQAQTIQEIQGGDLPWVQANILPSPDVSIMSATITNLRKIPTNSVMVSYIDMVDYYNANYPETLPEGVQGIRVDGEGRQEWVFSKNILFPALAPGKDYPFYQKTIKGFVGDRLKYDFDITWRGGVYTYHVSMQKIKDNWQIASETFIYKAKSYSRAGFIARFFSDKTKLFQRK